ncbi:MAG TPA: DUF3137 domain-containing protein, partial [Patescibacteria group bacterium]
LAGQWNKGMIATKESLKSIQARCPFDLKGFDFDSGTEFINDQVVVWCLSKGNKNFLFALAAVFVLLCALILISVSNIQLNNTLVAIVMTFFVLSLVYFVGFYKKLGERVDRQVATIMGWKYQTDSSATLLQGCSFYAGNNDKIDYMFSGNFNEAIFNLGQYTKALDKRRAVSILFMQFSIEKKLEPVEVFFTEHIPTWLKSTIKTESDDFDKAFTVRANNIQDALYDLNPKVMEKMLAAKKEMRAPLDIELRPNNIFFSGTLQHPLKTSQEYIGFWDLVRNRISEQTLNLRKQQLLDSLNDAYKIYRAFN